MSRPSYIRRHAPAWISAAFLLLTAILLASHASGATSSPVIVSVDIASSTSLDVMTGCAPNVPNVTSFGIVPAGTTTKTGSDCTVTFGSSNDSASLRLAQADGLGSAMAHPTDSWIRSPGGISARNISMDAAGGVTWSSDSSGKLTRYVSTGPTWWTSAVLDPDSAKNTENVVSVPTATSAWYLTQTPNQVLRSTNAGAASPTFPKTAFDPPTTVNGIAATSSTQAWVVGDNGKIYSTSDGGASAWSSVASGVSWIFTGVTALDADSVAAWSGTNLLATANGTTWRDISPPTTMMIRDVQVIDDNTMVVLTASNYYRTTNALNVTPTWISQQIGAVDEYLTMDFATPLNGVAIGRFGGFSRTTDGGVTWTIGDVGNTHSYQGIAADSSTSYMATGGGQNFIRSTDSGLTWVDASVGAPTWTGVSMATDAIGWRVGNDGHIEKTIDGSVTWSTVTSPTTTDLFKVRAIDSTHAVAIGRTGTIVMTSDGTNWSVRASGSAQHLYDVATDGEHNVWAVGANNTILHSSDQGATWSTQYSAAGGTLRAIVAFDRLRLFAAGTDGIGRRSIDGGVTWTTQVLAGDIRDIAAAPGTLTGVYASNGRYWRTTDAGATWTDRATSPSFNPNSITMPSPQVIVGVSDGSIRWSQNGGATFQQMVGNQVAYHWVIDIDSVDRSRLVAVGDGNVSGYTGSSDLVADYAFGTTDWSTGADAFGVCLRATTATARPTWTVDSSCDQTTDGPHWKGIPAATGLGSEVARTALGDGNRTASFRFGLRVAEDQPPGELSAGVLFQVIAPVVP